MTHARTKVRATVKIDSIHLLTADLVCQFALPRAAIFNRNSDTAMC
jgi:hypothetical protein